MDVFVLATILLPFIPMRRTSPVDAVTKGQAQKPGRPKVHLEAWSKVSVVLFARQVTELDRLARAASTRGHKPMTRACIIRSLIDGLLDSGLDVSLHSSEAELREQVARQLKSSAPG